MGLGVGVCVLDGAHRRVAGVFAERAVEGEEDMSEGIEEMGSLDLGYKDSKAGRAAMRQA